MAMDATPNLGLEFLSESLTILPNDYTLLVRGINRNMAIIDALAASGGAYAAKKSVVSDSIVASAPTAVFTASDDMLIEDLVFETDSVGLAGGTNVRFSTDNDNGSSAICEETVANLGQSVTVEASAASVPLRSFVLEAGKSIWIQSTDADCTGLGVLVVAAKGRKIGMQAVLT